MAFTNERIFLKLFFGKEPMPVKWLFGLEMKADNQRCAVLSQLYSVKIPAELI